MLSLITVPTDLLASISATSSSVFTDLLPVGLFVIGIGLAFTVVSYMINKVRGRKGRR